MSKAVKKLYITITVIFFILLSVMIIPPFMSWWNKPELTSIGWPISEIAIIVFSLLMCATLILGIFFENKLTAKEREMRKRGEKLDY